MSFDPEMAVAEAERHDLVRQEIGAIRLAQRADVLDLCRTLAWAMCRSGQWNVALDGTGREYSLAFAEWQTGALDLRLTARGRSRTLFSFDTPEPNATIDQVCLLSEPEPEIWGRIARDTPALCRLLTEALEETELDDETD